MTNRGRLFGLGTNHETRFINQTHHRQMKGVAQVDKTAHFLGAVGSHGSGKPHRVVGHDSDRMTVQPGQPGDL